MLADAEKAPEGRANQFSWHWAYLAEAALLAYERTEDTKALDWFVGSYEQILCYRDCELGLKDTHRGRVTRSWGSGRYLPGEWVTHVTMGGRIAYPSLLFARIVNAKPELKRFQEDADRYTVIAEEVVQEYEEDVVFFGEADRSYYRMPAKGGADTINHVNALANCHILLWELTRNERSHERASMCCEVFKDTITVSSCGAYQWSIRPYWDKRRNNLVGERMWKARVSSATALLAYKAGIGFDRADMEGFARTVTELIIPEGGEILDRVDEEHARVDPGKRGDFKERMASISGFLPWSEFDPVIESRIMHIVNSRKDLFPRGPLSRPRGVIAYVYML